FLPSSGSGVERGILAGQTSRRLCRPGQDNTLVGSQKLQGNTHVQGAYGTNSGCRLLSERQADFVRQRRWDGSPVGCRNRQTTSRLPETCELGAECGLLPGRSIWPFRRL